MCIESLLGLRGCESPEPSTGLYIDDLGINQTFLGQLITDQYRNGVELFEDKRAFAWRKLSSDVLTKLSPMMKSDTIIESKRVGQVLSNYANEQTALGARRRVVHGDAPIGRLESAHPVGEGGETQRAADVVTVVQRPHAGRRGRPRPT